MTTETANLETGCYIGSSWGRFQIEMLKDLVDGFELADYPAETSEDDGAIIHHFLYGDEDESITLTNGQIITREDATDITLGELWDELTNRLPAADGHVWFWSDGELFYWTDEDAEEWSE